MDEKTMRDIATIVSRGAVVPATNGLLYVLIALIHKLVEKEVLSNDDVRSMLDLLEDTIQQSDEASETEKAIVEKTPDYFVLREKARLSDWWTGLYLDKSLVETLMTRTC